MKNLIIIIIIVLSCKFCIAQNSCQVGGAISGDLGFPDCNTYFSDCPEESDALITIILETDFNGNEISWTIEDITENKIISLESNFADDSEYTMQFCAQKNHCYRFTIEDSAKNGIHPNYGFYKLHWNGELLKTGGVFSAFDMVEFGACCSTFSLDLTGGIACNDYQEGLLTAMVSGGTPPYTYSWSTGESQVDKISLNAQSGIISLVVEDAAGCEQSATFDPNEAEPLTATLHQIDVSSSGNDDGSLECIVIGGVAPYQFNWSNGESTSSLHNLGEGNYTVLVTDITGCKSTISVDLEVCNLMDPAITKNGSFLTSSPAHAYQWYLDDYPLPGETNQSIEAIESGLYHVVIMDAFGCTARSNVITDVEDIAILPSTDLQVYPNPSSGLVHLNITNDMINVYSISVIDALGRLVIKDSLNGSNSYSNFTLDLSSHANGIYTILIESNLGVYSERIILSR